MRGAMKILYVEDNEDNVYMLTRRLRRHGFEIAVASDGERGIAAARAERPDLILMDLSLPVLDGWEATRRLKAAPETRSIPIIALSAHAMEGDREQALAAGCDDYDIKPVDLERLLSKIRALLPAGAGT
jgi:CheY-like chemotaxis protein